MDISSSAIKLFNQGYCIKDVVDMLYYQNRTQQHKKELFKRSCVEKVVYESIYYHHLKMQSKENR